MRSAKLPKILSVADEHILWIASEKYMLGEINSEKLKEIELTYSLNLKEATITKARKYDINVVFDRFKQVTSTFVQFIFIMGISIFFIFFTRNAIFLILLLFLVILIHQFENIFFPKS